MFNIFNILKDSL